MNKEEAIEVIRKNWPDASFTQLREALEILIPELKESEDERIRKEILECIETLVKQPGASPRLCNWIAYLEKQKEQKFTHHEIDESLQDAVTRQMEDDGDVDDFVRRGIDDIVLKYAMLGAEWQKEQQPAKWSKEDEEMLADISWAIRHCAYDDKRKKRVHDWFVNSLNSLRPQPKRDGGDDYNKGYIKGRADAIKEFDDMPHWKPSEEQPEVDTEYIRKGAVIDAIKLAYGKVSVNPFDCQEAFEELFDKLN